VKWQEGKKLGSGTSGEVYVAMNIKNNTLFAVKKLQFMTSSGIDKEAIMKLRVSFLDLINVERD
jgi:serine/threonine protein kinase